VAPFVEKGVEIQEYHQQGELPGQNAHHRIAQPEVIARKGQEFVNIEPSEAKGAAADDPDDARKAGTAEL